MLPWRCVSRRGLLIFLCLVATAHAAPQLTSEERKRNLQSFDYVWQTIRDKHWDVRPGGNDWEAVRKELRPRMESAATQSDAEAVLDELLGRLHQSHFKVFPAEVYSDLSEMSPADFGDAVTGIDARVLRGKAIVTAVETGSTAAQAGVKPGWEIAKVRGVALEPAIRKVQTAHGQEPFADLLLTRAVTGKLKGFEGSEVEVEFIDGNSKSLVLKLRLAAPRGVPARFGLLPPTPVWIESKRLPGDIGYIHFNMFLDPARLMAAFADAVATCRDCRGIVIDIRGNPGGLGIMASGMAGWFIDQANLRLGTMTMRDTSLKFIVYPRQPQFRGPLAILVDGSSASTSEIFAGGMKDLGRARIFGTRTAGAALPSVFERLPNGDGFQYAVANYISEGGKPLEGVGVTPDQEVELTREALLTGRDPVIDAASAWIQSQSKAPPAKAKPE